MQRGQERTNTGQQHAVTLFTLHRGGERHPVDQSVQREADDTPTQENANASDPVAATVIVTMMVTMSASAGRSVIVIVVATAIFEQRRIFAQVLRGDGSGRTARERT